MAVVVNTRSEQEEKVLIAFLQSLKYEFHTDPDFNLTDAQSQEILNRDRLFMEGKTTSRSWNEIKQELRDVYH